LRCPWTEIPPDNKKQRGGGVLKPPGIYQNASKIPEKQGGGGDQGPRSKKKSSPIRKTTSQKTNFNRKIEIRARTSPTDTRKRWSLGSGASSEKRMCPRSYKRAPQTGSFIEPNTAGKQARNRTQKKKSDYGFAGVHNPNHPETAECILRKIT